MKPLFWDAINPATGQPYTFDDPNLRWGDPSYILEPGDPGYTPVSPANPTHPTRPKKMKRQAYYPSRAADQIVWLENLRNKLAGHAPALGLTVAECEAGIADARWLVYVLGSWLPAARAWALSCTDTAKDAQDGDGVALSSLLPFTPPALPAGVVAVKTGALVRLFALVGKLKEAGGYTEAIGTDLGLIGSEDTAPNLATVQPVLTATVSGGKVEIGWSWEGYRKFLDLCEIQVDRGAGWVPLVFDTTPGYTDSAPHPAALTRWKYRAIYHVNDAQVGLWSAEASVTVGG